MNWTIARITELTKEIDALDNSIKDEQVLYGSLKNSAMERGDETMTKVYADRLDEFMVVRAAIDTVIEYLDGREVKL